MSNNDVRDLVNPAFDDEFVSPDRVIALTPSERDTRLFVQQSAFTLHGNNKSLEEWRTALIPEREKHRELLVCAFIPAYCKAELRDELEKLGIHEASLFPDLGNLARYVRRDKRNWRSQA